MELLITIIWFAAGLLGGFGSSYLIFKFAKRGKVTKTKMSSQLDVKRVMVDDVKLERIKRELRTLSIEKEALASALTRLYEAEAEGKITKDERERLASKYREQLRMVESKLSDIEVVIEVGELERLREDLVSLFEDKITKIERRLEEARARLRFTPHIKEIAEIEKVTEAAKVKKAAKVKEVTKAKEQRKVRTPEEQVKAWRDEVYEALARLEQIDIEK
jgi:hypothetical protein